MEDCNRAIHITTYWSLGISILCLSLLFLFIAPTSVFSGNSEQLNQDAPDSINATIEGRNKLAYDPRRRSLFPEFYYKLRKKRLGWLHKHRIDLTLTYDALAQGYNDRDQSIGGASGDLSLSGRWLMFGDKFNKPIYLSFRFRDRRAFKEYAPSDIQEQTDLLWGTVKGFNDSGFEIPDLYFDQHLFDGDLALRYGQFSIDKFVDKHALRNAKRFFLNQAFSDNPTINFPSYGAGFAVNWKPHENWEIIGGGSNIQSTDGDEQVDFSLDSTALFGTIQVAYNFKGVGDRSGRFQVMGWGSDENEEEDYSAGSGLSFTLEHDGIGAGENYVLRYAQSSDDPTNTDIIIFLGYGKEIRGFDHFGLGVGAGQSSTGNEWQTVIESYYRWQVTKELLITPDVQLILGDDVSGENKIRFVAGIRAGIVF